MEPIGFFDSGIGGTTIWREVVTLLPNENTILFADSKNAPYGLKSKDEIVFLCEKNTEFLLNNNSKIIVVACNTATVNAIAHLRQKYSVPFIGIEPAIKPASLQSQTKRVGVLATQGTLSSQLFHKNCQEFGSNRGIEIVEQVGHQLVELIENGALESNEMKLLLKKYLEPMLQKNIDYLVLGCTHYPYLIPIIQKIVPPSVQIIDSGKAVAKQTKVILQKYNLLNKNTFEGEHIWITNKNPKVLESFLPREKKVVVKYNSEI